MSTSLWDHSSILKAKNSILEKSFSHKKSFRSFSPDFGHLSKNFGIPIDNSQFTAFVYPSITNWYNFAKHASFSGSNGILLCQKYLTCYCILRVIKRIAIKCTFVEKLLYGHECSTKKLFQQFLSVQNGLWKTKIGFLWVFVLIIILGILDYKIFKLQIFLDAGDAWKI